MVGIPQKNSVPLMPTKVGNLSVQYVPLDDGKITAALPQARDTLRDDAWLAGTQAILRRLTELVAAGQSDGSIGSTDAPDVLARFLYQAWLGASLLAKQKDDVALLALYQDIAAKASKPDPDQRLLLMPGRFQFIQENAEFAAADLDV